MGIHNTSVESVFLCSTKCAALGYRFILFDIYKTSVPIAIENMWAVSCQLKVHLVFYQSEFSELFRLFDLAILKRSPRVRFVRKLLGIPFHE